MSATALLLGSLLSSFAASVHATDVDPLFGGRSNFSLELRFGRYNPDVDSSLSQKPYERIFGTDWRFAFGVQFDWQALHIRRFGTLGVGVQWNYTSSSAPAMFADGTGVSAETTSLSIMPMGLLAVLKVDVLAAHYAVPLVPYAKLGPALALWWSSNGSGTSVSSDGRRAQGTSWGGMFALGAMLLLNPIEPHAARAFHQEHGVQRSYLFGEFTVNYLSSFGSKQALNVGNVTWNAGLAFEF